MNKRNADYIMSMNPRALYPNVDNKLLTKKLSKEFGIPTPELYLTIGSHGAIHNFQQAIRNFPEFVVKPARGAGGSGIILIVNTTNEGYVKQSGEILSRDAVAYHLTDILSGIYSLEGLEDIAIFEALIHPHPVFDAVTYRGVPDIRIISYRGFPVMSMVRLPTKMSDGKANLHRGAIGAGIDISTGTTVSGISRRGPVSAHPDTGATIRAIHVPFWNEILMIAAKACDMTGLGYLGVDLVIDRETGPLLLELNARPGLQIQLANMDGLLRRLEKIDKLPAALSATAEERIQWAMENFKV